MMKKVGIVLGGTLVVFGGLWAYQAHQFGQIAGGYVKQFESLQPLASAQKITVKKYLFRVDVEKPVVSSMNLPGIPQGEWRAGDKVSISYVPLTRTLKAHMKGPMALKVDLGSQKQLNLYTEDTDIEILRKPATFFGDDAHGTVQLHLGSHKIFSGHNNSPIASFDDLDITQSSLKRDGDLDRAFGVKIKIDDLKTTDHVDHFISDLTGLGNGQVKNNWLKLRKDQRQYEGGTSLKFDGELTLNDARLNAFLKTDDTQGPVDFFARLFKTLAPLKVTVESKQKNDLTHLSADVKVALTDKVDIDFDVRGRVEDGKIDIYKDKILRPSLAANVQPLQIAIGMSIKEEDLIRLLDPLMDQKKSDFEGRIIVDPKAQDLDIQKLAIIADAFSVSLSGQVRPDKFKLTVRLADGLAFADGLGRYMGDVAMPIAASYLPSDHQFKSVVTTLAPLLKTILPQVLSAIHQGEPLKAGDDLVVTIESKDQQILLNGKDFGVLFSSPAIGKLMDLMPLGGTKNP